MSTRVRKLDAGGNAASKAALLLVVRTLAKKFGPGDRGEFVGSGDVWTKKLLQSFPWLAARGKVHVGANTRWVTARTALRRIQDSNAVTEAVRFFEPDLSRCVAGRTLRVKAGYRFD